MVTIYFAILLQLQNLVGKDVYLLFEQKLRDWNLQHDPNFVWCANVRMNFLILPLSTLLSVIYEVNIMTAIFQLLICHFSVKMDFWSKPLTTEKLFVCTVTTICVGSAKYQ